MVLAKKTTVVAKELGVKQHKLHWLLRNEKIPAPEKDSSDDYVWSPEDIERARQALAVTGRRRRTPAT